MGKTLRNINSRHLVKSFCVVVILMTLILSASMLIKINTSQIEVKGAASKSSSITNMTKAIPTKAILSDYENQIAVLINNVRVENGLNALAADETLTNIAKTRSGDMVARGYLSHYTPEGTNVFNLIKGSGFSYRYAGENLAQSQPASIGSPDAFLNAWLNSPSHRANILRAQYNKIGVGMIENGDRRVVTTVFSN